MMMWGSRDDNKKKQKSFLLTHFYQHTRTFTDDDDDDGLNLYAQKHTHESTFVNFFFQSAFSQQIKWFLVAQFWSRDEG